MVTKFQFYEIVRVIAEAPTVGEAQALITKCREPLDKLK